MPLSTEDSEEEEVDELESDSSDEQNLPDAKNLMRDWSKSVPIESRARWYGGPQLSKQRQQEAAARERAKTRRQEAKKDVPKKKPARGKAKAPATAAKKDPAAKKPPSAASKTRKGKENADVSVSDASPSGSEGEETDSETQVRKRARTAETSTRTYTAYIHVERPPPAQSGPSTLRGRFQGKPVTQTSTTIEQHGPVILQDQYAFDKLLEHLAQAVGCLPASIPISQLFWRFEKPANNSRKPLRSQDGYTAMLSALEERAKDRVVVLHMPPAAQPAYVMYADASSSGPAVQSEHPYDNYAPSAPGNSIREQMTAMGQQYSPFIQQLEARYPVDNYSHLFPRKRIYSRNGRFWELTSPRMTVWAGALDRKEAGVDLENAPNSMHFAPASALRTPTTPVAPPQNPNGPSPYMPANSYFSMPGMPYPQCPPFFPPMHAMPPFGFPVYPQFSQHSPTQQPPPHMMPGLPGPFSGPSNPTAYGYSAPAPAPLPAPLAHARTPPPQSASVASSSTVPQPLDMSIADFCAISDLSSTTAAMLEALGATVGHPDLENTPLDRVQAAGFTFSQWQAVVVANGALLSFL